MTKKKKYIAQIKIPLLNEQRAMELLVFNMNLHKYALCLENVSEIIRIVAITTLPEVDHDLIEGVINLRGEVIPVLDLHKYLCGGKNSYTLNTHIIIIQKEKRKMGLIVDCVDKVAEIPYEVIRPTQEVSPQSKHLMAIAKTADYLLLILDIDLIFSQVTFNPETELSAKTSEAASDFAQE